MKEIKVIGIDLAAKEKNPSGICKLYNSSFVSSNLSNDEEILGTILNFEPNLIAIDAPLTKEINRVCDKLMKKYGAMPLKMQSIMDLANRAIALVRQIRSEIDVEVIEVFPTGTAKILGFYDKDLTKKISLFKGKFGIKIEKNVTDDEFDAVVAALTGFLHNLSLTQKIGDENGWIVIPNPEIIKQVVKEIQGMHFTLL